MTKFPRRVAWWSVLSAGSVVALVACDGGDGTGTGGDGGRGGGGATTTSSSTNGGGGAGGMAGGGSGGEAGTGGTAGMGGAGGATSTGKPDGDTCTTNEECEHGFCLTQEQFGWPYGACSGPCNSFIPCADGSTCSNVANNPFCLKNCSVNDDCKQGKVCTDIGSMVTVCLPVCTSDAECEGFGECNETTGACTPSEDCEMPGDEDDNALSDCEDGDCVTSATCLPKITAACDGAVPIVVAAGTPVVTNGDTFAGTDIFGSFCSGGGSQEDVFSVTVPAATDGILEFSLVSQTDLALYVRDTCENDQSTECVDNELGGDTPEVIIDSASGGKQVWVFVDGSTFGAPNEGSYALTTTLYQNQPESEPNGDLASADPLSTSSAAFLATGSLDQTADDDDWFLVDTTALVGNKTITAETIGFGGTGCAPNDGDVDTFVEIVDQNGLAIDPADPLSPGENEDVSSASNWCSRAQIFAAPPAKYYVHVKTSALCLPDPMGPDCAFTYGVKINLTNP